MSTRGIIARVGSYEGTFVGRYNHNSSYPTWMGPHLLGLLTKYKNVDAMLADLLDKHPAGWSAIGEPGRCFCHPTAKAWGYKRQPEKDEVTFTEKDLQDTDCEWLFAFDCDNQKLFIRDLRHREDAGVVDLAQTPPTKDEWTEIECGSSLERCSHIAAFHGLVPQDSRLSTQAWLGRRPFEFRDAVAVLLNGRRYRLTGSGYSSNFMRTALGRKLGVKDFPADAWVATLQAGNGKRFDAAVARILPDGEYQPAFGASWVYPAIKNIEHETVVG